MSEPTIGTTGTPETAEVPPVETPVPAKKPRAKKEPAPPAVSTDVQSSEIAAGDTPGTSPDTAAPVVDTSAESTTPVPDASVEQAEPPIETTIAPDSQLDTKSEYVPPTITATEPVVTTTVDKPADPEPEPEPETFLEKVEEKAREIIHHGKPAQHGGDPWGDTPVQMRH